MNLWLDDADWPEPRTLDKPPKRSHQLYVVAVRLEPESGVDLFSFAQGVAYRLGGAVEAPPKPEDKSLGLIMELTAKSPQRALSGTSWRIDRAIRKSGFKMRRVSYDVVDAEAVRRYRQEHA